MAEKRSAVVETTTETKKEKNERKKAEKKKSKKRKKSEKAEKSDDGNDSDEPIDNVESKNPQKEGKNDDKVPKKKKTKGVKSSLKSKKEEKAELVKKIPLKNEDGIAYTKFQIRQMMKRVKRGLAPVATPKELDEKRQNDGRLRREEEAELAGLTSTRNTPDSDEDSDDDSRGEGEGEGDNNGNNSNDEIDDHEKKSSADPSDLSAPLPSALNKDGTAKKKSKRNKPIPSDYICQACKNRHEPSHWIYDCPDKVTVRGTNKKRKKERGVNDPDSKKVFVSGLPFDVKAQPVEDFFSVTNNCGTVAAVRLIHFEDTKRCNGQAYVLFDTDEGAQRAIGLSGTTLDAEALSSPSDSNNSRKKKKDGESPPPKRKELKLKVSKVLNRRKTKPIR